MVNEYEGPNMTIYKNPMHFVKKYIVPSDNCKVEEDKEVESHELIRSEPFSGVCFSNNLSNIVLFWRHYPSIRNWNFERM